MKKAKTNQVDFEKDHLLFEKARASVEYKNLLALIKKCTKVLIIGNGGMMDVSSHAAADLSRLIDGKAFTAFNDAGFITSSANDFGFDHIFTKWLQTRVVGIEDPKTTLILGLSCSGNSTNIVSTLTWAHATEGFNAFLISGAKSKTLPKSIGDLCFGCKYFHTTEVLTMKLIYDIVHKLGHHCPDIAGEIERKAKRKSQD